MGAHEFRQPRPAPLRVEGLLTWLGGGDRREVGERDERSTHAVAGAVVLLGAVLAWVVATIAVSESVRWPALAVLPLTLIFGLLIGAVIRGTTGGANRRRSAVAGRAAVAVAVGVVVGELAALVVFSSAIDRRLDDRGLRDADSAPPVAQAAASLQQTRDARVALDQAVERARAQQDRALVVARCEYNPTPACPQTQITGVPGAGPETRTANELLADAQRQLDTAVAARDRQVPELDSKIGREQQALTEARRAVVANAGRGFGARWVAMNELTFAGIGALSLRLALLASCALLYLLPLILGLWRGQTTQDRRATARAQRDRAELEAETAIAVKRAEVRREAEIMWAEHQLTQARLAIAAQTEIDRAQQRRRVQEAFEGPVHASAQRGFERRVFEPREDDVYLPIAAEAEAASRALTQVPADAHDDEAGIGAEVEAETADHLPARISPTADVERHEQRATPLIPSLPDATKAAARWIRPLVPPFVARAIDNTTAPLRTARQVFEEVEEITFSLKRTRKVTMNAETTDAAPPRQSATAQPSAPTGRIPSSRGDQPPAPDTYAPAYERYSAVEGMPASVRSLGSQRDTRRELEREERRQLRAPEGPRQLPPAD